MKTLKNLKARQILVLGGFVTALVMTGSGVAAIYTGVDGREEVRDTLAREQIYGPEDSTIPGQLVDTGSEARAQADIMREHQLASTNGLTYAQMGRFAVEDGNPAGTNNADEAAKDANGKPISNAARTSWVTETALTTSLETAYFAEQVGLFAIVVGVALVLSGVGFAILTFVALWHTEWVTGEAKAPKQQDVTGKVQTAV
jgi:hypothetical protein